MVTLVTVFFSFLSVCLGAVLSHIFTIRRADKEYRLKKLEELSIKVLSVQRMSFATRNACFSYSEGKLNVQSFHEMLNNADNNRSGDVIDEIRAVAGILFQRLDGRLSAWFEARDECIKIVSDLIGSSDKGERMVMRDRLGVKFEAQRQLAEELIAAMIALASDIREVWAC